MLATAWSALPLILFLDSSKHVLGEGTFILQPHCFLECRGTSINETLLDSHLTTHLFLGLQLLFSRKLSVTSQVGVNLP